MAHFDVVKVSNFHGHKLKKKNKNLNKNRFSVVCRNSLPVPLAHSVSPHTAYQRSLYTRHFRSFPRHSSMKGKLSSPATAIVINLINGCCCGLVWNARPINLQLLLLFFIINHHALVIWFLYSGVFCSLCQSVVVYWIPSRSLPPSIRASSCHYSACAVHEVCKWHPTLKFSVDWWKFRIIECFLSSSSSATPAPGSTTTANHSVQKQCKNGSTNYSGTRAANGWWEWVMAAGWLQHSA